MTELQPVIQVERSGADSSRLRNVIFLGMSCAGIALGAFAGYNLVDSADQDESAVTARNTAIDECLGLVPEEQLTGCAPELIQGFGFERYVNIDNVSLSAGGSLVLVTSTNAELLKDDLKRGRREIGFEPENPAYRVAGLLIGGSAGLIIGAGMAESTVGILRPRKKTQTFTYARSLK